jgi:glycerol-3-phosphate dehydrogenase (NAD(P)+)
MSRICVLGDGAWGTALASLARDCGHDVSVWSRKRPDAGELRMAGGVIIALPAQAIAGVLKDLAIAQNAALIIAAKGIDRETNTFMHQRVSSVCPYHPVMILSGPSFADDVQRKLPTAVTLAAQTLQVAEHWSKALSQPHFRIYASDDLMGVAIGGSLKNVLAIACGISDGKQLGASARAALIARGFSELSRLGQKLGAKPVTLSGLSGLGDLLLTCSSAQSRNYAFGFRLGEGMSVKDAIAASKGVVEGVYSAHAALTLAREHDLKLPITEAVFQIVEKNAHADDMIKALLSRPVGAEFY